MPYREYRTIIVTRHCRPLAQRLHRALANAGYAVHLSGDETDIGSAQEPALVLLTGEDSPEEGAAWARSARHEQDVPLFTFLPGRKGAARGKQLAATKRFGRRPDSGKVVDAVGQVVRITGLKEAVGIVGTTEPTMEMLERAAAAGATDHPVLITGETGTGKELIARAIHQCSPRKNRRLVPLNVASLPDSLVDSELFGHEEGAFTGASSHRKGFFEQADGGTLFLDEIGELPLHLQPTLLRALEEGEFFRVGGDQRVRVDVRLIAATNCDLWSGVRNGAFRGDLYHRLCVLPVRVPPLRERRDDVPALVRHFLAGLWKGQHRRLPGFTGGGMEVLLEHSWPGNVRELRNVVLRLSVKPGRTPFGPKTVRRAIFPSGDGDPDLPSAPDGPEAKGGKHSGPIPFSPPLRRGGRDRGVHQSRPSPAGTRYRAPDDEAAERADIVAALRKAGSIRGAAREIGASRDTVYRRINKYDIRDEEWREARKE